MPCMRIRLSSEALRLPRYAAIETEKLQSGDQTYNAGLALKYRAFRRLPCCSVMRRVSELPTSLSIVHCPYMLYKGDLYTKWKSGVGSGNHALACGACSFGFPFSFHVRIEYPNGLYDITSSSGSIPPISPQS